MTVYAAPAGLRPYLPTDPDPLRDGLLALARITVHPNKESMHDRS